jgi:hypothetical protein
MQMIEDHYGHINPVKNAERIRQGLPGWEPISAAPSLSRDRPRLCGKGEGSSRPVEINKGAGTLN